MLEEDTTLKMNIRLGGSNPARKRARSARARRLRRARENSLLGLGLLLRGSLLGSLLLSRLLSSSSFLSLLLSRSGPVKPSEPLARDGGGEGAEEDSRFGLCGAFSLGLGYSTVHTSREISSAPFSSRPALFVTGAEQTTKSEGVGRLTPSLRRRQRRRPPQPS